MKILQVKKGSLLLILIYFILPYTFTQTHLSYQQPPAEILELVDVPQSPRVYVSPSAQWMAIVEMPSMPSIAEVSQPELRIGGLRINPRTNGPSRDFYYGTGISLLHIESGELFEVTGLPLSAHLGNFSWAPDESHLAFSHTADSALFLWAVNVDTHTALQLSPTPLNAALRGRPFEWSTHSQSILCKAIPRDRGVRPLAPSVPKGPVISENAGKEAPNRTYQDLLKNPFDESLFEYYTQAQLLEITVSGEEKWLDNRGIISSMEPSPDGAYWLVEKIARPFSYLVPYYRYAQQIEVWDSKGALVKKIASIPAAEDIPKGFGAVRKGPRSFEWRPDLPATLYWVEAQDQGDPNRKEAIRDRVFLLSAPFDKSPTAGVEFELRYGGIDWVKPDLALTYEYWYKTRSRVVKEFSPQDPEALTDIVFKYSTEDRYNDPGRFVSHTSVSGHSSLLMDKEQKHLFLIGSGASPEGSRPFIDSYELGSGKTKRIWQSTAPYYAYPVAILDPDQGVFIVRKESTSEPPNYYLENWKTKDSKALTSFSNPYPAMETVKKEELSYMRKDSVALSGTLYTPPAYTLEDGPLPTLIWAYPREYKSAAHAGQRTDSPFRFPRLSANSPIVWVMRGYAVLNNAAMPIVGEGKEEPNDSFVDQLVMNAEAAIDKLVDMGVGDRNRMAIAGHSYGAFMTANLLAHSDLFATGIARSGAYNRSLTPFGFQREERTFWEAPEIYFQMSPFMNAEKVNEPLLLIHGQADNNSGTFPMQSERFYNALKGHGATTRLVMLPNESHGYRGRESLLHVLWETDQWLDKYLNTKQ